MVGNPFPGEIFTLILCTRIPFTVRVVQSNSTAALLTEIWLDGGKERKYGKWSMI